MVAVRRICWREQSWRYLLVIFLALARLGLPAFACMNFMAGDRFFTTTALFFAQQYCWTATRRVSPWRSRTPGGRGHVHRVLVLGFLVRRLPHPGQGHHLAAAAFHALPPRKCREGHDVFEFIDSKYDACDNYDSGTFCFCDEDEDGDGCGGREVLKKLGVLYDLPTDKNTLLDLVWPLGLALLAKATAVVLFARRAAGRAPRRQAAQGRQLGLKLIIRPQDGALSIALPPRSPPYSSRTLNRGVYRNA